LTKSSIFILILGVINAAATPVYTYEIINKIRTLDAKQWGKIPETNTYRTIKSLKEKKLVVSSIKSFENMPDKTVYCITELGKQELLDTLKTFIVRFDYDTNVFSIATYFINIFPIEEQKELLKRRLIAINKYLSDVEYQASQMVALNYPKVGIANLQRIKCIVAAEISGTQKILESLTP
jgi:DNA-binding PadR family transcriptional regulator